MAAADFLLFVPAPIAGLSDCKAKPSGPMLTRRGSALRLFDPNELGHDPEPKQRLFDPLTKLVEESGERYPPVSLGMVWMMLLLI